MLLEILKDTLTDSLKMLPFLLVAYFFIEYLERHKSEKLNKIVTGSGKWGFIPGSLLGLIPQCGFSAMIAELYTSHVISLGTMIAVFLSTSDEAIPVLIAHPERWKDLGILLLLKLLVSLFFGFVIDIALSGILPRFLHSGISANAEEIDCHDHNESESLIIATFRHAFNIFIYVFIIEFLLGATIEYFGAEEIGSFIQSAGIFEIFIAALIGMIPNCAASVLLTELYISRGISFAALFAGLCTGSGLGALILIKSDKNKRRVALILLVMYIIGVICGLIASVFT